MTLSASAQYVVQSLWDSNPAVAVLIFVLVMAYFLVYTETLYKVAGRDQKFAFYALIFTFPLPTFILYRLLSK